MPAIQHKNTWYRITVEMVYLDSGQPKLPAKYVAIWQQLNTQNASLANLVRDSNGSYDFNSEEDAIKAAIADLP
jgi:hypothetical protein